MNSLLPQIRSAIRKCASKKYAKNLSWFFKTGPGEYGEGDIFLGLQVPKLRKLAKQFKSVSLDDAFILLRSKYHEERLLALFLLIGIYKDADAAIREKLYRRYLASTRYINNWDLVDLSAPNIPGIHLKDKNRSILFKMAGSADLWERRIAIISTSAFIRSGDHADALAISRILLNDRQDLIHKAVGWMLREIGKRDGKAEREFLNKYYTKMPRTMLRYAIERFPETERQRYLKGKI